MSIRYYNDHLQELRGDLAQDQLKLRLLKKEIEKSSDKIEFVRKAKIQIKRYEKSIITAQNRVKNAHSKAAIKEAENIKKLQESIAKVKIRIAEQEKQYTNQISLVKIYEKTINMYKDKINEVQRIKFNKFPPKKSVRKVIKKED